MLLAGEKAQPALRLRRLDAHRAGGWFAHGLYGEMRPDCAQPLYGETCEAVTTLSQTHPSTLAHLGGSSPPNLLEPPSLVWSRQTWSMLNMLHRKIARTEGHSLCHDSGTQDLCTQNVLYDDVGTDFATVCRQLNPDGGAAPQVTLILDVQQKENLEMVAQFLAKQLESSRCYHSLLREESAGADAATSMRTEALLQQSSDAARRLEAVSRFIRVRDRIPYQTERCGQYVQRPRLACAVDPASGSLLALALYELRHGQEGGIADPKRHVFLNEVVSMHQLRTPVGGKPRLKGVGGTLITALQHHAATSNAIVLKPLEDAPGLVRYYCSLGFVPHDVGTAALTDIDVEPYQGGELIRFSHRTPGSAGMKRVASRDLMGG